MPEKAFDVVAEIYVDAAAGRGVLLLRGPRQARPLARLAPPSGPSPRRRLPNRRVRRRACRGTVPEGGAQPAPGAHLGPRWGEGGGSTGLERARRELCTRATGHRRSRRPSAADRERRGDDVPETPTLYNRRPADQPDLLRCEWCARPAQVVPIHVAWPDGQRELNEPVLCPVCAAIFELGPPLRDVDRDPQARAVAVERRRQEAKGVVCDLLTERYAADGKPRPAWMTKPAR